MHCSFTMDETSIRKFKNMESKGVPLPKNQPMRIYTSLWNTNGEATSGGLVKTYWTQAPFIASYKNFNENAYVWSNRVSSYKSNAPSSSNNTCLSMEMDSTSQQRLQWAQKNYMIYTYCSDGNRFPQGLPPEYQMSQ
ncbi:hypothetical protein PVK06_026851 [Gossypium arboreum]|uniref:xyloglucan:xyloglucosyl transferase n=1 Tax=Gossypium arboreum TaxID=29729 RepID=A0ABR0NYS7_GOSAR|nr:hypothetical protein PVK06_026851 [Gossypium arboreum]